MQAISILMQLPGNEATHDHFVLNKISQESCMQAPEFTCG